jgi:methionine synthase I (cobalamin-dependent)
MPPLLDRLKSTPLLLADGAWGSYFIEQRLDVACEPADAWNLRHPDLVTRLAEEYAATADILTTNTFGANRVRLSRYQLNQKMKKINTRGVAILREVERARRILDRPLLIAGSMGPVRGPNATNPDDHALFDVYQEQAICLAEAGASFLLLETFSDPSETRIAVRAVKSATPLEVVCSFAFRESQPGRYETWSDDSVEAALKTALDEGADMVGANCVPATDALPMLVDTMRRFTGPTPLWLKPNAGTPTGRKAGSHPPRTTRDRIRAFWVRWLEDAVDFIEDDQWNDRFWLHYPHPFSGAPMDRILEALGHGVIGGCCGTSPPDIKRLRQALSHRANLS